MTPFERKRRAVGLTQQQIADRLGISQSAVGKWDRGEAIPSPEFVPKLAELLGLSGDEVVHLFDSPAATAPA